MNASVSVGPASLVADYLGVAPPRHSVNNSGSSIRWTKKPSKGTKTRNNTKSKTNKTKNNTNSKKEWIIVVYSITLSDGFNNIISPFLASEGRYTISL